MTRIFGITIITAVGLAACGQTNTDHKNHESTKEKKTEQKEMKMNQEVTAPKEMNQGASNDLLTTSLKKCNEIKHKRPFANGSINFTNDMADNS